MKILINGTFDILHLGHIMLLNKARAYKDSTVFVLIDSDRRVKELKGSDRPFNSENERALLLANLKSVDMVEIFDSDMELEGIIKGISPDIMLKGSDYIGKKIIGAEYCKEVIFYERIKEFSSTEKIQRLLSRG
jgi:rfaE bifunctional protein nucleotidyltransferase chain/domain